MNLQSYLLLALVLLLAGTGLWLYIKKNRRTGGCDGCNCYDCALRDIKVKPKDCDGSKA